MIWKMFKAKLMITGLVWRAEALELSRGMKGTQYVNQYRLDFVVEEQSG